jgi:hypothetical protein
MNKTLKPVPKANLKMKAEQQLTTAAQTPFKTTPTPSSKKNTVSKNTHDQLQQCLVKFEQKAKASKDKNKKWDKMAEAAKGIPMLYLILQILSLTKSLENKTNDKALKESYQQADKKIRGLLDKHAKLSEKLSSETDKEASAALRKDILKTEGDIEIGMNSLKQMLKSEPENTPSSEAPSPAPEDSKDDEEYESDESDESEGLQEQDSSDQDPSENESTQSASASLKNSKDRGTELKESGHAPEAPSIPGAGGPSS